MKMKQSLKEDALHELFLNLSTSYVERFRIPAVVQKCFEKLHTSFCYLILNYLLQYSKQNLFAINRRVEDEKDQIDCFSNSRHV